MSQPLVSAREQFGLAIGDCARIWRNKVNQRLKPLGLSQGSWIALWHLAPFPDGLVQADLAERLGIEGPTLVRLLDKLEADGLVERQPDPRDRRCKRVVLSERAGPLVDQVRATIAALRGEIMADIPDAQIAAGLAALNALREKLDAA